jgi:FkbM family methyltransferase
MSKLIKHTRTRYSKKFHYYANDVIIGQSLELYGEYSELEVMFLVSVTNKNCIVYDIGANIGYHTTAFASQALHVYAFEPHPKTFDMLLKNTKHLPNVTAVNYAISNFNGTSKCLDYDPELPANYGSVSVDDVKGVLEVQCASLNHLTDELPDIIKIDVEGNEYAVVQGCIDVIRRRNPVVYFEAHETPNLAEILDLLGTCPYVFYWAPVMNYNPNNFKQNKENIFGGSRLTSVIAWPSHLPALEGLRVVDRDDLTISYQ